MAYDSPGASFPGSLSASYPSQDYIHGRVSKTWNADNGTGSPVAYNASWYSYDELGRTKWMVQEINGLGAKTIDYTYDMMGNVLKTEYQKGTVGEKFVHDYTYDADKRLLTASTTYSTATTVPQDKYYYYRHGALKREELATDLQGIDYVYTINGWLKSINDPTLTSRDPGKDSYTGTHSGFGQDVFGLTLDYFSGDYSRCSTLVQTYAPGGSNTAQADKYSGITKAQRWKTQLPSGAPTSYSNPLQYTYFYDNLNRFTKAIFGEVTASGSINDNSCGSTALTYSESTDYREEGITYDMNGNILTLKRNGHAAYSGPGTGMDDLTYNYDGTKKNRLTHVDDAGSAGNYSMDIKDQASANFTYDALGRITANAQENYSVYYNPLNLTKEVKQTSTGYYKEKFIYNERGKRQKKTQYDEVGALVKDIYYVYDGGGNLLATYEQPGGSGVALKELNMYAGKRLGKYDLNTGKYLYELSDHLGNVRATVTETSNAVEVLSYTDYYAHGSVIPGRNYVNSFGYKFGYQGIEKDNETGFNNFDLRSYDARYGRWFNVDPMGQHHSPYLAMSNNPITFVDPTGGWDGDTYSSDDEWGGGDVVKPWWAMNRYERIEMQRENGTLSSFDYWEYGGKMYNTEKEAEDARTDAYTDYVNNNPLYLKSLEWVKPKPGELTGEDENGMSGYAEYGLVEDFYAQYGLAPFSTNYSPVGMRGRMDGAKNFKDVLDVADFIGVSAAAGREILLDYRQSLPLMDRVGMSTNLKTISTLGSASKFLGIAGYGAAGVGTVIDINSYRAGEISGQRLTYNMTGTGVGIGVGVALGPVAGATVGGSFWAGQQLYDGYMYWEKQMSIFLVNFENGLKNGWVPGRR